MLDLSFRPNLPPLLRGGSDDVHTIVHYKHFIFGSESSEDPYNYVDIGVFFNTIVTAILVTIINLCFCYPISFYMAKVANPNAARLLIVSLIIPFWINELLRSFALRILFAGEGVINNFLIYYTKQYQRTLMGGVLSEERTRKNVGRSLHEYFKQNWKYNRRRMV